MASIIKFFDSFKLQNEKKKKHLDEIQAKSLIEKKYGSTGTDFNIKNRVTIQTIGIDERKKYYDL